MISIHNVSFSYQETEEGGIQHISLLIKQGECVVLCGRSGCGKSTVTRLINGLIPHFYTGALRGKVEVAGMDMAETPLYTVAEQVGSVFQNPRSQFFHVDTDSEIAFGLENLGYPVEKIQERMNQTIRDLRLERLAGRNIFHLSGGEKQKLALASVYALSPTVYVLDEPSANLDLQAMTELGELLTLLKGLGKTIVIAEHRLHYLKAIADRIVYMENGCIANEYTCADFLRLPAEERAAKGLRSMAPETIQRSAPRMALGAAVLEMRDVAVAVGKTTIVEHVNMTVSQGEVIGVTGGNGTGKSTFAQTLCGLRKEAAGLFCWRGLPVGPKQRIKLAYMVMQEVNYQLFAESVEEECCLGLENPDERRRAEVLKKLSLYELRYRHPASLSGGQQQRTAVAVSQLCKKEILIFDEPTSGLDFAGMRQVSELMKALAAEGKVIFVVTHDYEFLISLCSRVIYFADGRMEDSPLTGQAAARKLKASLVI